jgi:hypothetical protein
MFAFNLGFYSEIAISKGAADYIEKVTMTSWLDMVHQ